MLNPLSHLAPSAPLCAGAKYRITPGTTVALVLERLQGAAFVQVAIVPGPQASGQRQMQDVNSHPTLVISKDQVVKGLDISHIAGRADKRLFTRMTSDGVALGNEIEAFNSADDLKRIICGLAAELMGTDGVSVAGCRLRLVAC